MVMNDVTKWHDAQMELGFETVWSLWECESVDVPLMEDKSHRVFYRFYAADATIEELMNDTAEMIEVSAFTAGGTVRDFWRAAESCWKQAKAQGDWHKFIEDFSATENGFELTMGS